MSIVSDSQRSGTLRFSPPESLRSLLNRMSTDVGAVPLSADDVCRLLKCLLQFPNLLEQAAAENDPLPFDPIDEEAHIATWCTVMELRAAHGVPQLSAIRNEMQRKLTDELSAQSDPLRTGIEAATMPDGLLDRLAERADDECSEQAGRALLRRFLIEREIAQQLGDYLNLPGGLGESRRVPSGIEHILRRSAERLDEIERDWGVEVDWPVPESLDGAGLPPFPTDSLPRILRDWVMEEATATQTPPDMAAMLALAVCAAAGAKQVIVLVRAGWREPINIFAAVVLEPGNRKSAVVADASAPLRQFEREQVERSANAVGEYERNARILQLRQTNLERQAAKGDSSQRQQIAVDLAAVGAELASLVPAHTPKLLVDDCTVEQVEIILAQQRGRVAVLTAEGGIFNMMQGRYGDKANFDVYLKGHAGDELRTDRVGRQAVFVPHPAITLGLSVQPQVIHGLGDSGELRGKGLLARFQYSVPQSLLGRRDTNAPPVTEAAKAAFHAAVLKIARMTQGSLSPHELTLSPEAASRFSEFESALEPKLSSWGELAGLQDWAGKLAGAVIRLAGILHLIRQVEEYDADVAQRAEARSEQRERQPLFCPWDTSISLETISAAIAIGDYLVPHARAAFKMMGLRAGTTSEQVARGWHVLRWIHRQRKAAFTKRDVQQGNRAQFPHAEDVDPVLDLLVQKHIIRPEGEPPANLKGGRPASMRFRVNPAVHTMPHICSPPD